MDENVYLNKVSFSSPDNIQYTKGWWLASGTRSLARRSLGSSRVLARGSVELGVLGERDSELTSAGGEVVDRELNSSHLVDDVGTMLADGGEIAWDVYHDQN